jgi:NADP-dependent 3-hydroxy acid dehydrogenase YdfG
MTIPAAPLDGTVALVTGASSGIGEATARALAAQDATVGLAARREDRLDALASDIRAAGGTAVAFPADITAAGEAERLAVRAVARLGRLDTLVNAAGVMLVGPALDAPAEEWQRNVDLNVSALLRLTHAALPHLVAAARQQARGVDGIREQNQAWYASMETLQPQDIADAVTYIVTRPRHVAVNELLIRPTEQA